LAPLPEHLPFYDKEHGRPRGGGCCKKEEETNLRKTSIVEENEQKWIESGSVFFHVFRKLCMHKFLFLGDNILFLNFSYVFLLLREFH
jgi:hypothetical protein